MNGANPSIHSTLPRRDLGDRARRLRRSLSALSFWSAIALPSVYLPPLVAGIDTTGGLVGFLVLFGLHVSALVGGRHHGRPDER